MGQIKPALWFAFDLQITTLKTFGFVPLEYIIYYSEWSQNNYIGVLHLKIKIPSINYKISS